MPYLIDCILGFCWMIVELLSNLNARTLYLAHAI